MARGEILNSIPDLQIEWATKHSNLSVRGFLIDIKGFSPRQYRHIISKAKLLSWTIRKEEIQNSVASATIGATISLAVKTHEQYYKTSQFNLAQITKKICQFDTSNGDSEDLLNLSKALSLNQNIAFVSLGIPNGIGIQQILEKLESEKSYPNHDTEEKTAAAAANRLSYDDIVDLIKERRLRKQKTNLEHISECKP